MNPTTELTMHVLARKNSSLEFRPIPLEAKQRISELLRDLYNSELEKSQLLLDFYGFIFPEEFILSLTLMDQSGRSIIPKTLLLSVDMDPQQTSFEVVLPALLDGCAVFLEQATAWSDEDLYADDKDSPFLDIWTEETHKGQAVFTKLTRENIALTLMADEILREENLNWQ